MELLQIGILSRTVTLITEKPLGERLTTASLNTLIGLFTVFAVLILITLIIYLFKLFPNTQSKQPDKPVKPVSSVDNAIAQIVEQEEEELNDDFGLVAVITAAIYASMGDAVPEDGLIVRSIRKVNTKRRMNA